MSVTITLDTKDAIAAIARLAKAPGQAAMRKAALAMKQQVYDAFRFQRNAATGAQWPGLSPLTLAARARKGNHSIQPLVATGAMYASIEASSDVDSASVSVGAGLPDARSWYNQFGTRRAPARAFLPVSNFGTVSPTQAWLDAVKAPIVAAIEEAAK